MRRLETGQRRRCPHSATIRRSSLDVRFGSKNSRRRLISMGRLDLRKRTSPDRARISVRANGKLQHLPAALRINLAAANAVIDFVPVIRPGASQLGASGIRARHGERMRVREPTDDVFSDLGDVVGVAVVGKCGRPRDGTGRENRATVLGLKEDNIREALFRLLVIDSRVVKGCLFRNDVVVSYMAFRDTPVAPSPPIVSASGVPYSAQEELRR